MPECLTTKTPTLARFKNSIYGKIAPPSIVSSSATAVLRSLEGTQQGEIQRACLFSHLSCKPPILEVEASCDLDLDRRCADDGIFVGRIDEMQRAPSWSRSGPGGGGRGRGLRLTCAGVEPRGVGSDTSEEFPGTRKLGRSGSTRLINDALRLWEAHDMSSNGRVDSGEVNGENGDEGRRLRGTKREAGIDLFVRRAQPGRGRLGIGRVGRPRRGRSDRRRGGRLASGGEGRRHGGKLLADLRPISTSHSMY